jgi:hypothetical protein
MSVLVLHSFLLFVLVRVLVDSEFDETGVVLDFVEALKYSFC